MMNTTSTRLPVNNDMWDPHLVTGVVIHFIQNHMDLPVPDWHLTRHFYDSIWNWMNNQGYFQDVILDTSENKHSRRNEKVEKLVLKNFHLFINDYFVTIGGNVDTSSYEKIIQNLENDDRIIKAKRELVGNYFLPRNEIINGYFPYPNPDALRVVMGIIRNWVFKEWKAKYLDLDSFLMMNRLKESESISLEKNRLRLELIVLENQFISPPGSLPCFLINLICPVNHEIFSVKIKGYFSEIREKAIEKRNCINKYLLALKAKPGDRVKLSGEIQKVYRDIKWNALCKRLKNLRRIQIQKHFSNV